MAGSGGYRVELVESMVRLGGCRVGFMVYG
jgi:hypothetical protein